MSCFSYARLGSQCEPNTSYSLTSNAKYIFPLSKVYYKPYTSMLVYPGNENLFSTDADSSNSLTGMPKQVKAFAGMDESQQRHHFIPHSEPVQQKRPHCTSCRTWN